MRRRTANTHHSYYRAAMRCGWTKKQAKLVMQEAGKKGKSAKEAKGELRDFLLTKQFGTTRRIKFYLGFVFVFASTSTKCYTVYPLPMERFSEEGQNEIKKLIERQER